MKYFVKPIVFANFFVAISVSSLLLQSYWVLGTPPNLKQIGLLFFATLSLYNLHRTRHVEKTLKTDLSERHYWAIQNKMILIAIIAISSSLVGYFSYGRSLFFFIKMLPAVIIALGYTIPVIKMGKRYFRFRDIPGIKVSLIAFTVSYLTLVLGWEKSLFSTHFFLLFLERFFFISAITIPFDIRDLHFDEHSKLKTLPAILGREKALLLSYLLLFMSVSMGVFLYFQFERTLLVQLFYGISLLYSGMVISRSKPKGSELFYSFGVEGTMVVQTLLVGLALYFQQEMV